MQEPFQAARWTRYISVTAWVLAFGPSFLLLSVLLHASTMYLNLGRWPKVYRDDPVSGPLLALEWFFVVPSIYWAMFGVPAWVAWVLAFGKVLRPSALLKQLALIVAAATCLALVIEHDSTGYVEWFLD